MRSIVLSFDSKRTNPLTEEVQRELDSRGIPYSVALVDTYGEPRLTMSGGELVGDEIFEHMETIAKLHHQALEPAHDGGITE